MFRHFVNLLFSILPPSRLFKFRRFLLLQSKIFVSANSKICGRGWFYGRGDVFIGENSWLSPGVIFYTHNEAYIKIGKNCDIGPGVKFIIGSHSIGTSKRRAGQGTANSIIIGDGCWIGAGAIILDGIKIEDGCIIAAGAVVTKDVGINKLVAGVPAVLKRNLFSIE
jgi:maltose O-acetyltransferase